MAVSGVMLLRIRCRERKRFAISERASDIAERAELAFEFMGGPSSTA